MDDLGAAAQLPRNAPSSTNWACMMDLGQKDLAPVFTSCRNRKQVVTSFESKKVDRSSAGSVHTESFANATTDSPSNAKSAKHRWIVVWKAGGPTAEACTEAEATDTGRFYGNCSARFTNVFEGFAVEFTRAELLAFLRAYSGEVASVHEDTEVRALAAERPAPWALDRIDQPSLPLNGEFDYYNLGTNVNIYIVDTVSCP
ncbi:probable aqualysin-1 at C-terminar half [Coccomyxa sp. Obi]|nr:probable aqualysin-1 at C-terminar half [Coccomyxa sp. Obi]